MPLLVYPCHDMMVSAQMWFDINSPDYVLQKPQGHEWMVEVDGQKIKIKFGIFENIPNQMLQLIHTSADLIITNCFDNTVHDKRVVYNDFLFNRTKAYYSGYPFRETTPLWYHVSKSAYDIPAYQHVLNKKKIYVAPIKTYRYREDYKRKYRTKLFEFLLEHQTLGHIGNFNSDSRYFLVPQVEFPNLKNLEQVMQSKNCIDPTTLANNLTSNNQHPKNNKWGYSPPHSEYYRDTFISIYTESIEYGTTVAVTEKTYDPLIKGHFVLPFGAMGLINYLKHRGFEFPKFIDYSYDLISDDDQRYKTYQTEVSRLIHKPMTWWQQQWESNRNIIRNNQLIFFHQPYDVVDFSLLPN